MNQRKYTPIHRHPALIPFGLDHYNDLLQAQQLIEATQADTMALHKAIAMFVTAWDAEIADHFHDEEHLLVDLMQDQDRQRLLDEHEQITRYAIHAGKLRSMIDPDATTVRRIGKSLRQHIRWEELELYVRLQQQLSQEKLADLQRQTQAMEATRHRSY